MEPRVATGRYSSRAKLIFTSVSAATTSFSFTSVAVSLDVLSTFIRDSSSTREPFVLLSRNSRLSSRSFILHLFPVTSSSSLTRWDSNSCFSERMTRPNSWSSNPFMVTVKSMIEVRALISGV